MKKFVALFCVLLLTPLTAWAQVFPATPSPGGTGPDQITPGQSTIPGNPGSGGAVTPGQSTIPGNPTPVAPAGG